MIIEKDAGAGERRIVSGSPAAGRRLPAGATATPIDPGVIATITGAGRALFDGWFGPGVPLSPIAPPEARGRLWNFPFAVNTSTRPRQEGGAIAGPSFEMLRRLADPTQGGLDLMRMAIETRKDQMSPIRWRIVSMEDPEDDGGPAARKIEALMRKPDGQRSFRSWQRLILEDHFVVDAVALYYGITGLTEVMDPATIKPLIDIKGRRPVAPAPAFQQQLHGIQATNYTADEIGMYVYNERSNRLYGMSRVEQAVGIISLALNRQLSQLAYYTSGNMPEALLGVPDSWTPEQIQQAQEWFDAILEGNVEAKRKGIFVPGGLKPQFLKEAILKDQFDEYLARIICFCFSLPPTALVKETNRATAGTTKVSSQEEGLEPTKLFMKEVLDDVIARRFGRPDLQAVPAEEEITDPLVKAQVDQIYLQEGVVTRDEVRSGLGKPKLTPEQKDELDASMAARQPLALGPGETKPGDAKNPAGGAGAAAANDDAQAAQKLLKAGRRAGGRALPPVPANHRLDRRTQGNVRRVVAQAFAKQRHAVVAAVRALPVAKADASSADVDAILDAIFASLPSDAWDAAVRALIPYLEGYARERAKAAIDQLNAAGAVSDDDVEAMFSQANQDAIAWSVEHAADLVTEVSDRTKAGIRAEVTSAIEDGLSNDELADQLAAAFSFSDDRAMLIARTETSFAENRGTIAGFGASGVVSEVEWSISQSEVCDICEPLDGVRVALGDTFPGVDVEAPPAHPRCRCTVCAVIDWAAVAGDGSDGGDLPEA